MSEASELFWKAFRSSGSSLQTCVCGRTHFASSDTSGFSWEEGELEWLLEKSKSEPERYVEDGRNDSISWIDLGRGPVVWGCPCCGATPYENFIWEHRERIMEYFRLKAEEGKAEQVRLESALAKVKP